MSDIPRIKRSPTKPATAKQKPPVGQPRSRNDGLVDEFEAFVEQRADRLFSTLRALGVDQNATYAIGDRFDYNKTENQFVFDRSKLPGELAPLVGEIIYGNGRYKYSRPPVGVSDELLSLYRAVEVVRVNRLEVSEHAGAAKYLKAAYEDDFCLNDSEEWARLINSQPKFKQFALSFVYMWAAGVAGRNTDPLVTDPDVTAAIHEALPFVEDATRLGVDINLALDPLTPEEIDAEATRSYGIIEQHIWPIFQRLLIQDKEEYKEQLEGNSEDGAQGSLQSSQRAEGSDAGDGLGESRESAPQDSRQKNGDGGDPQSVEGFDALGVKRGANDEEALWDSSQKHEDEGVQQGEGVGLPGGETGGGGQGIPQDSRQKGGGVPKGAEGADAGHEVGASGQSVPPDSSQKSRDVLKGTEGVDAGNEVGATGGRNDAQRSADAEQLAEDWLKNELKGLMPDAGDWEEIADGHDHEHGERVVVNMTNSNQGGAFQSRSGNSLQVFDQEPPKLEDMLAELEAAQAKLSLRTQHLSRYEELRRRFAAEIEDMVSALDAYFERSDRPAHQGYYESGSRLSVKKWIQGEMGREVTGVTSRKVFTRREVPQDKSSSAVMVLDGSGSMMKYLKHTEEAVVVIEEGISESRVRHGVIVFDTNPRVLKEMDEEVEPEDRERIFNELSRQGKSTNDLAALKIAEQMLDEETSNQKVIFFVTDAEGAKGQVEAVRELEEKGTVVVAVAVGMQTDEQKSLISSIYSHCVMVPNAADLPKAMAKLLVDIVVQ